VHRQPSDRIVIVGAGLAGLAAALRLAGAGRHVTVVEKSAEPGGLMGRLHTDGYTFDTGPTVLTMPELIDDALASVGESRSNWLDLVPVDPAYRAVYADGSVLHSYPDRERMTAEVGRVCGSSQAAGYRDLVDYLARLFAVEFDTYMACNLDGLADLIHPQGIALLRLGGLRSLDKVVGKYLTDERVKRLFTFQSMYAGLAPSQARAIYGVIAYLDSVAGVWFPRGGMYQVAAALAGAAAKHGVEFRCSTTVTCIEVRAGRATAVVTNYGERIDADVVIYNGDLAAAYRDLLPTDVRPPRLVGSKRRYSPSALVWHLGSSARMPNPEHHTISFGTAWDQTFREVIDHGRLMSDPSLLITNPTATDPTLAPSGKQTFYVLAPCPNLEIGPIDWGAVGPRYVDELRKVLQRRGFDTDGAFSTHVEVEHVVTPADWQASGLSAGTPFALAHTVRQTGPMRHPTRHPSVTNLLFCGAGAQPGIGIPTTLLSGRLAAQRILG